MNLKCAMLIAEFRNDSYFIEKELNESFLNVVWLGSKFNETIKQLSEIYRTRYPSGRKRFMILHWTPSVAIAEDKFTKITLPRCEDFEYLQNSRCRYDLTPIVKYYEKTLDVENRLTYALRSFFIWDKDLEYFREKLSSKRNTTESIEQTYNEIACSWMKERRVYNSWKLELIREKH